MKLQNIVDDALTEFGINSENSYSTKYIDAYRNLSLGVPADTKAKFEELQEMTEKKFGKALQQILKKVVDEAYNKK